MRATDLTRDWTLISNPMPTAGLVKVSMASGFGLKEASGRLLEFVFATEIAAPEGLAYVALEGILLSDAQARSVEMVYTPP